MTTALITCAATLGPLHCTRVTTHPEHRGCVFQSTSGVPDRHQTGGDE